MFKLLVPLVHQLPLLVQLDVQLVDITLLILLVLLVELELSHVSIQLMLLHVILDIIYQD